MKKYEILLFDLDDTLIDNTENTRHAFKVILEYMKDTYSEEKFKRWYELDKQFWLDRVNGKIIVPDKFMTPKDLMVKWTRSQRFLLYFNNKISLEKAMELNDLYIKSLEEKVIPIEGAKEIIEYLSKTYTIVIATNGPSLAAKTKLEKIGCLEYVSNILAADMLGYMKPTIEYFNGIKKQLEIDDSRKYLVIGDSLNSDVEGAMNANMDSCWFNRLDEEITTLYHPTIVIKNLDQLKEIL